MEDGTPIDKKFQQINVIWEKELLKAPRRPWPQVVGTIILWNHRGTHGLETAMRWQGWQLV